MCLLLIISMTGSQKNLKGITDIMRLSRNLKSFVFLCIIGVSFCSISFAENVYSEAQYVTPVTAVETPKKIVSMATAKTEDTVELLKAQKSEINELKGQYATFKNGIEQAGKKIEGLEKALTIVNEDIKKIEEKNIELSGIVSEMDGLKTGLKDMEDKFQKDKVVTDKYMDEFSEMKTTLREKVDKLQSYSDIMDVLKKELNNNEIEIARLKKEINMVRTEAGGDDSALDSISRWPYMGISAVALSLVAFIIVMVKK